MAQTHSKRQKDIKSKLMAAVSMLLVSSIMMVSSTYAWFTLSTAPEVTGISTSVGANGNLEMALQPTDGNLIGIPESAENDATKATNLRNLTWGNLVDLGAEDGNYGLDQIELYPAKLNLNDLGKIDVASGILSFPSYGSDGRVDKLLSDTFTGTYAEGKFPVNTDKGVRAVGTASGMTPRQMLYRDARSAANVAATKARNDAAASLKKYGNTLANVAIAHAAGNDADNAKIYTQEQVAAMRGIVGDLRNVLAEIEKAYTKYVVAYIASAKGQLVLNDADFDLVYATLKEADSLGDLPSQVPTDIISAQIAALEGTTSKVASADSALNNLSYEEGATFTWGEISPALSGLVNVSVLTLNDLPVSTVKDDINGLIASVMSKGVNVGMPTDGGVYADVADHVGNFDVQITIDKIEYKGMGLTDVDANMATKCTANYLNSVGTNVESAGAPTGSGVGDMPLSEFYGYIVDLAFRTNAADSNLLLQVEPADRIYKDNAAESETRGHGSTMTFKAAAAGFTDESVKDLMANIRVVFFNTGDGTILANAKLDMSEGKVTTGADGITAPICIYTSTGATTNTVTYVEDENGTYGLVAKDGKYYVEATGTATHIKEGNTYVTPTDGTPATHSEVTVSADAGEYVLIDQISAYAGTKYKQVTNSSTAATDTFVSDDEAKIMPLTQNTATALSVLVYLDGESIQNSDVAALGSTSMTGTMNLQFASSANLVPMEYASLHTPGAAANP